MKKIISLFLIFMIFSATTTVSFAIAPAYIRSVIIEDGVEVIYLIEGTSTTLEAVADTMGFKYAHFFWMADDESVIEIDCGDFIFKKLYPNYGKGIYCSPPVSSVTITGLKEGTTIITVYADYPEDIAFVESKAHNTITVKVISKPQMYYTDGTFSITSNYDATPVLALYKENAFVNAVTANELNVSSVDFDEISVIYLDELDTINPIVPKISLTKEQVLALPSFSS